MNLSAGNFPTKTAATAGPARKTVQRGHSLPPAFRGSGGYGPGCAHRFSHKLIEHLIVGLVEKRGATFVLEQQTWVLREGSFPYGREASS